MNVYKYINKYSPKEEESKEASPKDAPKQDYSKVFEAIQDTMGELETLKDEQEDKDAVETLNKMKATIRKYIG